LASDVVLVGEHGFVLHLEVALPAAERPDDPASLPVDLVNGGDPAG
jgi:hypothetical protein